MPDLLTFSEKTVVTRFVNGLSLIRYDSLNLSVNSTL